jgi:hypothetical protein
MRLLEAGSVPMAVWLGKNVLGQKDNITSISMVLPPIRTAQDVSKAAETVTQAIGRGKITPGEGGTLMNILDIRCRIFEKADWESRLEKLEQNGAVADLPLAA